MDFFSIEKQPLPQKGDILLSEPFIQDQQFSRAVILICESTEAGSMGLVLNKPVSVSFESEIPELNAKNFVVSMGGPVDNEHLYYIHTNSSIPKAENISGSYYFGGDFNFIKDHVAAKTMHADNLHFYIGYSGWESEQLKEEIEDSCWLVVRKPDLELVFKTDHDLLWKKLVANFGGKYKSMSEYPLNPSNN